MNTPIANIGHTVNNIIVAKQGLEVRLTQLSVPESPWIRDSHKSILMDHPDNDDKGP